MGDAEEPAAARADGAETEAKEVKQEEAPADAAKEEKQEGEAAASEGEKAGEAVRTMTSSESVCCCEDTTL